MDYRTEHTPRCRNGPKPGRLSIAPAAELLMARKYFTKSTAEISRWSAELDTLAPPYGGASVRDPGREAFSKVSCLYA